MDTNKFDHIARTLGGATSRRGALAGLLAGMLVSAFPHLDAVAKRGRGKGNGKGHGNGNGRGKGNDQKPGQGHDAQPNHVAAQKSKKHGGGKTKPCKAPKTRCGKLCVDLQTNPTYCGSCKRNCKKATGSNGLCRDGLCLCEGGIICNQVCIEDGQCCVTADCPVLTCHDFDCLGNQCTYDALPAADGTPCQGGVCCNGACEAGSDTCGSSCATGTTPCGDECCRPNEEICCGVFCYAGDCCDDADCVDPAKPICSNRHNCEPCSTDQQCSAAGKGNRCCDGVCIAGAQCCHAGLHCGDRFCQDAFCEANQCVYRPDESAEGRECPGGVCCNGNCLAGPECCLPAGGECCVPDDCQHVCQTDFECILPQHTCFSHDLEDGSPCPGGACCDGQCLTGAQCCRTNQCEDRACNDVSCVANECVYTPDDGADSDACPGGVCCGGACLGAGRCCEAADCAGRLCQNVVSCTEQVCRYQSVADATFCEPGQCCDGFPTDTQTDAANCGACGYVCGGELECRGGVCCKTLAEGGGCIAYRNCDGGRICGSDGCGGNCGECPDDAPCNAAGTVCGCEFEDCDGACCEQGQVCHPAGECCTPQQFPACPGETCGTSVSDGCGAVQECLCGLGGTCCNGACFDTNSDPDHCGSCERVCPRIPGDDQQEACVDGECTCTPQCQGKVCGPDGCNGSCGECPANTTCNAAGSGCDCPFENCQGTCCGQGQVCDERGGIGTTPCCTPGGAECTPGLCSPPAPDGCGGTQQCLCEEGLTCCNGVCVDTSTDAVHCGGCGEECPLIACGDQHETCVEGECIPCGCGDADRVCFLRKWGSQNTTDGNFWGPHGIAVAPNGDVYTADVSIHRVQYFACNGTFKGKWGKLGSGQGDFTQPYSVAVAPNGDVYVTDTSNRRIQYFGPAGAFKGMWGTARTGDGQFTYPRGVAVAPNGDVYVSESGGNDRVQHFDAVGNYQGQWGSIGNDPGQFVDPFGIAVAPNGDVYVADTSNNRIQVFDATGGNPIGTPKHVWGGPGAGPGQFNAPYDVAVAPNGIVYVSDSGNHRIQAFTATGIPLLTQWGNFGVANKQFKSPMGVAVAPNGDVYVMESNNHRVQAFCVNLP